MIVLAQSSFHTTWASLFEMELEPNSLGWNGNELEQELELELEDMKCTYISYLFIDNFLVRQVSSNVKMPNWIYM